MNTASIIRILPRFTRCLLLYSFDVLLLKYMGEGRDCSAVCTAGCIQGS